MNALQIILKNLDSNFVALTKNIFTTELKIDRAINRGKCVPDLCTN